MTEPREPTSKHFVSQGLKLHYLDWGNAEAPLLIFVHGMHDHARSWDHIARHMCQDWHVIAVDLRGHGDSQWSAEGLYHNPLLLLDFANLIDALGAEQVSIVAHSLGGNPSARFAALYPQRVKKLVLVDAMGPSANVIEQWNNEGVVSRSRAWVEKQKYLATRSPRRFANLAEATARMAKANAHLSAEQAEYLTRYGVREHNDGLGWKYDPATGNFSPEDFEIDLAEYWAAITAPTLLCWGPESWTSNPATDGRASHFCNHRTLTFDKSGHWIHHDQPEQFIAALHAFFDNQ